MYYILKELKDELREKYLQKKIDLEIFQDSITDIDIWAKDYYKKYGKVGIREFQWLELTMDMRVFKLGRFQFEKIEDPEAEAYLAKRGIVKNAIQLNVHIQEGGPLDFRECQKSYKKAAKFYDKFYNFDWIAFVCDSWLLNQELKDMLPRNSNIISFQKQYHIISEKRRSRQFEERVFGTIKNNPLEYKARTSLQKRAKEVLIKKRSLGMAKGIYIISKEELLHR